MCTFTDSNGIKRTYQDIRSAMEMEGLSHYHMELVGEDKQDVIEAVNQGIDSHLEACFCPDRGDSYTPGRKLVCVVSAESLPVLLRRLFENDDCSSIASCILDSLGLGEY